MKLLKQILPLAPSLLITILLGLWPVIGGGGDAARERMFTVMMFATLATSLNILLGYTGYVSFGHIVFFGVGGYIGFYLIFTYDLPLPLAVLAGGLAAGVLAFLLGKAILHLKGAYFALATIGVNQAARAFVNNFEPFGGAIGLTLNFQTWQAYGGPRLALWTAYWMVVGITLFAVVLSYVIKKSKFGLGLMAIRENEATAEVMGVVTPDAKTWAYVLSAILPGMVGALFFFKNGHILPEDAFRLHRSIEVIVMVMLGGYGTVLGPVLGAAGYQRLRGVLLESVTFRNIQLAVAGVLLLVIILFIPAGAIGWLRKRFAVLWRWLE